MTAPRASTRTNSSGWAPKAWFKTRIITPENRLRPIPTNPLARKISSRVVGVTRNAVSVRFSFSLMIEVAGRNMPPRNTAMSTIRGSRRSFQGISTASPRAML